MNSSLNDQIRKFSNFLNLSWNAVEETFQGLDEQDMKDDWFQANWELLVERGLGVGVFLEVYGNGADCYGASSRITFNEELPTHSIVCRSKYNRPLVDLLNKKNLEDSDEFPIFDRLVTITDNGWYIENTPFDKALCFLGDDEVILNLDDISFFLLKNSEIISK